MNINLAILAEMDDIADLLYIVAFLIIAGGTALAEWFKKSMSKDGEEKSGPAKRPPPPTPARRPPVRQREGRVQRPAEGRPQPARPAQTQNRPVVWESKQPPPHRPPTPRQKQPPARPGQLSKAARAAQQAEAKAVAAQHEAEEREKRLRSRLRELEKQSKGKTAKSAGRAFRRGGRKTSIRNLRPADLKQAIVMKEILSPPLALRPNDGGAENAW